MPRIIPAKDLSKKASTCAQTGCNTRPTASSRHQPVLIDDAGTPYCQQHAREMSENYDKLRETFDGARKVVADAVAKGEMNQQDAEFYYSLWNGDSDA